MIICYTTDPTQTKKGFFETVDNVEQFKQNNPGINIIHIIPDKQEWSFEKFERLCSRFGFKPSDYRREININGDIQELVGFQPANHKYTCITYSRNHKGYRKSTLNYIMSKLNA